MFTDRKTISTFICLLFVSFLVLFVKPTFSAYGTLSRVEIPEVSPINVGHPFQVNATVYTETAG